MAAHRVICFYKHKGDALVSVTLDNEGEKTCLFDDADWTFLMRLGMSPTLSTGQYGYVRSPCYLAPGCHVSVARVLLDAGEGQLVTYKDHDKLNMRRDNLALKPGPAKHRDRLYLKAKAA
jgi:hypothetical protein